MVSQTASNHSRARIPSGLAGVDAWPADTNNDTFSDISDIGALANNFGEPVPLAPARHDIAPNKPDRFVDIIDISRIARIFGKSCR